MEQVPDNLFSPGTTFHHGHVIAVGDQAGIKHGQNSVSSYPRFYHCRPKNTTARITSLMRKRGEGKHGSAWLAFGSDA